MTGYVVKVGKKGELYTSKKLRSQIGLDPGSEFIAIFLRRILGNLDKIAKSRI
jgi:bifunctional DNA-binding transcriptional regulator/antitoxin component of YhaV-PrlF toxin-antitoxin module